MPNTSINAPTSSLTSDSITSIINSDLTKIGTATDQEYIDFSTSDKIKLVIGDTEYMSVEENSVIINQHNNP